MNGTITSNQTSARFGVSPGSPLAFDRVVDR
jgi:hypothetical protein